MNEFSNYHIEQMKFQIILDEQINRCTFILDNLVKLVVLFNIQMQSGYFEHLFKLLSF